jgi:hypothetical protein
MELKKSNRSQTRARIALQGPSGSGKTYSSLLLAYGICKDWNKIAIIDTESGSSDLYSALGPYNVLMLGAPFTPERYIEAIDECERSGMDVIVIDSLSHEWEGAGGILDIHSQMVGNSFTNWAKLTPKHNAMIQRILQSGKHIIATVRSKQDYVLSEKNGKSTPEKIGLKGIQKDGYEFEFTTVFELDINNNISCTKDRTEVFKSQTTFKIDQTTGEKIMKWCKEAEPHSKAEAEALIDNCGSIDELNNLYRQTPFIREYVQLFNNKAYYLRLQRDAVNKINRIQNGKQEKQHQ